MPPRQPALWRYTSGHGNYHSDECCILMTYHDGGTFCPPFLPMEKRKHDLYDFLQARSLRQQIQSPGYAVDKLCPMFSAPMPPRVRPSNVRKTLVIFLVGDRY
jgi:hypothetical protein